MDDQKAKELFESIASFLREYTDAEITPDSLLKNDLGLDSITLLSLVSEFEDRTGMSIPDEDLQGIYSVKDVVTLFEDH